MYLKSIIIKNFRSLKDVELNLTNINVIYGPTSSGKSSLIYAPLIVKNFVLNPNVQRDNLFYLKFINLGTFEECVHLRDTNNNITISIVANNNTQYSLTLGNSSISVELKKDNLSISKNSNYPFNTNPINVKINDNLYISWNGIVAFVNSPEISEKVKKTMEQINFLPEFIKTIDSVPVNRGFFKPLYNPVSTTFLNYTEDEIASLIIQDNYLSAIISEYLQDVANYSFNIRTTPGTTTTTLIVTDKKNKFPTNLINAGYGITQLVYMLAKLLYPKNKVIFIEEPEVHLHPAVIDNFAKTLIDIVDNEKKQIIIITHSEVLISALLTSVSTKKISPENINIYFVEKIKRETKLNLQKINNKGQLQGGIKTLSEPQLKNIKMMLGL